MGDHIQVKSHSSPDEVRSPAKTRVELVNLGATTIGRLTMEPGWSWEECIKPVVGTDSCQNHHVGYAVSGTLTVELVGGERTTIRGGDSYDIPPGHNAWVEGSEPYVAIEVQSAAEYAKPS